MTRPRLTSCRRLAAALTAAALTGCHPEPPATGPAAQMRLADATILQSLQGSEQLTTFVRCLQAAGMVTRLSGPGPTTVFAPTDDAFAALPPEQLAELLNPDQKDHLRAVLAYHLAPRQAVLTADAKTASVPTEDDERMLSLSVAGGAVLVNGAKIVKPDVVCTNGVIHWIDQVLLPRS